MAADGFLDLKTSTTIAGVAYLLYLVCRSIYRLYLSPLAKFPGPKLAALTLWYEFYYDVIKRGMYIWEIEKMHQKYGECLHRKYPSLCFHTPPSGELKENRKKERFIISSLQKPLSN